MDCRRFPPWFGARLVALSSSRVALSVRPGIVFKINLVGINRAKRQRFDKLARRLLDVATGTSYEDLFECVCRLVVQLRADVNAGQRSSSLRLLQRCVLDVATGTSFWKDFTREKPANGLRRPAGGRFDDCACWLCRWTFKLDFSRALFTVDFLRKFPSFSVVVFLVRGSVGLLSRSSSILYHSWRLLLARARSRSYCLGRVFAVSRLLFSFLETFVVLIITQNYKLLSVLGFDPMSLWGLVVFLVVLFSGNPGFTAGRGLAQFEVPRRWLEYPSSV
ncbi:hypothetical protein F511_25174 [Dorcoceras hygrometricum]|uniref:Uncharacterized protein n=1 Tax=Dorcoceras hygrometricum TaxID=472368 RepID=A0A2Z7B144_9LAMI|nr:hypothetical protein F511_25174 [Dorcoceras hygrometricum]